MTMLTGYVRAFRHAAIARAVSAAAVGILLVAGVSLADASAVKLDDMLGEVKRYRASHEDTLLDLARNNELGYVEIVAANPGVDPWVPGEGTNIVLPTAHLLPDVPREGIVINLGEHRLYYFGEPNAEPSSFPIGVGREGWDTPVGGTTVVRKMEDPPWYPPDSIREEHPDLPRAIPPGPDNPLGSHAIYFGWPGYLVHGTNMPWGIGRRVSHGCIRLYPENIAELYELVDVGTPVRIIAQYIKLGWHDGELYLEAHPEPKQVDELEREGRFVTPPKQANADVYYKIRERAGDSIKRIDWSVVRDALSARTGLPVRITSKTSAG